MAEPSAAQRRLAERLRELRMQALGSAVTQAQLAGALGTSVALVSSWENANAVPPEERLKLYALRFASPQAFHADEPVDEADLSDAEEVTRRRLTDELIALRDQAIRPEASGRRETGALGGRFWYFGDTAPIRIITTKMWPSVLETIPYADPRHPNYIGSFADADRDATIELFGHIRAENPTADVRFLTADQATQDDLTGHVVVLGQADRLLIGPRHPEAESYADIVTYLAPRLELPLGTRIAPTGASDFDSEFVVTLDADGCPVYVPPGADPVDVEVYRPRFLRNAASPGRPRLEDGGFPILEYDVALLARRPNQLNLGTTVTLCSGIFSRGTYGAVRALSDSNADLRGRNERFLTDYFGTLGDFWFLFRVPVFRTPRGLETVTPDLERPFHRLRSSA